MHPLVILIPVLVATSGIACFFVLPLPLAARTAILVGDLVAAVVVGWILFRRFHR